MNATRTRSTPGGLATLVVALLTAPLCGQNTASGETTGAGTVAGSYVDTQASDGVYEAITERESGGRPRDRTSYLSHTWNFNVLPGGSVTFFIKAYHTANTDGDYFRVLWSSDGADYQPLLDLTKIIDDGNHQSAALPPTVSGPLYIAVVDADRTAGNGSLDTVFVDHLYIDSVVGGPPVAPAEVVALDSSSSTIDITWTDMSVDEDGFAINRFDGMVWTTAGIVGSGVTYFRDSGLLPSTTYDYVVHAFNTGGMSEPSVTVSATTRDPGAFAVDRVDVTVTALGKDLAYDPVSGHPAIVYTDGLPVTEWIKFAQWNGSSWDIEEVASDNAFFVSMAFSPAGRPSIAYLVGSTLRYLERVGTVWIADEIDTRAGGNHTSLAYDANGEPAISYQYRRGRNGSLKLARRSNGRWSTEVVDETLADPSSLSFDQAGRPAIAYSAYGGSIEGVKLARWNGSSWDIELVESLPRSGTQVSLVLDPTTGWPAITHVHHSEDYTQAEVRFLHWSGSSWQVEVIAGYDGRLAYDEFGNAYIAYVDPSRFRLEVARWDGVAMQPELVSVVHQVTYQRPIALRIDPSTQQPSVTWTDMWGLAFARK